MGSSEGEIKDETKDIEKEEDANDLTEKAVEGGTKPKPPESSEQVSSKDQDTTEKSSEGEIKEKTKDLEKEEEGNDLTEEASEGEVNDKIAESSEQISSID